jgi:hypothetical protein
MGEEDLPLRHFEDLRRELWDVARIRLGDVYLNGEWVHLMKLRTRMVELREEASRLRLLVGCNGSSDILNAVYGRGSYPPDGWETW